MRAYALLRKASACTVTVAVKGKFTVNVSCVVPEDRRGMLTPLSFIKGAVRS